MCPEQSQHHCRAVDHSTYTAIMFEQELLHNSEGGCTLLFTSVFCHFPLAAACREMLGRWIWGDVITHVNQNRVRNERELFQVLDDCRPWQEVEVTVQNARSAAGSRSERGRRSGTAAGSSVRDERTVRVVLGERGRAVGLAGE